jgi:hypothetical protein
MTKYDCYGEDGRAVHLPPCSQALGVNGPCCSIDDDGTDANKPDHDHDEVHFRS